MDNERIREQHLRDASRTMAVEAARILAIDALMNDSESWEKWNAEHKGGSGGAKGGFPASFKKKTALKSGGSKESSYDITTAKKQLQFDGDSTLTRAEAVSHNDVRIAWPEGIKMRTMGLYDVTGAIDGLPGKTSTLIEDGIYLHPDGSSSNTAYWTSLGLDPNDYIILMNADSTNGRINIFYCDDTTGRGDYALKNMNWTLQHEVGHLVDKEKTISSSVDYAAAVDWDLPGMGTQGNGKYVSEYAKQYGDAHPEAPYGEDFADAFKDYCAYKESGASAPPAGEVERFKVIEAAMKAKRLN